MLNSGEGRGLRGLAFIPTICRQGFIKGAPDSATDVFADGKGHLLSWFLLSCLIISRHIMLDKILTNIAYPYLLLSQLVSFIISCFSSVCLNW